MGQNSIPAIAIAGTLVALCFSCSTNPANDVQSGPIVTQVPYGVSGISLPEESNSLTEGAERILVDVPYPEDGLPLLYWIGERAYDLNELHEFLKRYKGTFVAGNDSILRVSTSELILRIDERLSASCFTDALFACASPDVEIWKIGFIVQDARGVEKVIPMPLPFPRWGPRFGISCGPYFFTALSVKRPIPRGAENKTTAQDESIYYCGHRRINGRTREELAKTLEKRLARLSKNDPNYDVQLRFSEDVPFRDVVKLFDVASFLGVTMNWDFYKKDMQPRMIVDFPKLSDQAQFSVSPRRLSGNYGSAAQEELIDSEPLEELEWDK